jgi:tetratricopeptide (TPR) repeat protein
MAVDEEVRLEEAVRRADELFVRSLKDAEHRRRKRIWILGAAVAMVALLAAVGFRWRVSKPSQEQGYEFVGTEVDLSWQYMNTGRRADARRILDAAVKKNPTDSSARNALGWSMLYSGDHPSAKLQFQKAIELDANQAGSINGLAQVLKREGDLPGAIRLWQQMVDRYPGPHAGTAGLADAYLELSQFDKAVPLLEQLARQNPRDPSLQSKLRQARAGAATWRS